MMFILLQLVIFGSTSCCSSNSNGQHISGFGFELIEHHLEMLQASYEKLTDQCSSKVKERNARPVMNKQIGQKPIGPIQDCTKARYSGLYKRVSDQHRYPSTVYCEMESYGGGWLVIQQRFNGSLSFDRDWNDYQKGFGKVSNFTEFWLGLDLIHEITAAGDHELMIELRDETVNYGFARYSLFRVAGEREEYTLDELGEFSGSIEDMMRYHEGQPFSTRDRDNDESIYKCSDLYTGGWWYKNCANATTNGSFEKLAHSGRGIYWNTFARAATFSRMMIRAK